MNLCEDIMQGQTFQSFELKDFCEESVKELHTTQTELVLVGVLGACVLFVNMLKSNFECQIALFDIELLTGRFHNHLATANFYQPDTVYYQLQERNALNIHRFFWTVQNDTKHSGSHFTRWNMDWLFYSKASWVNCPERRGKVKDTLVRCGEVFVEGPVEDVGYIWA